MIGVSMQAACGLCVNVGSFSDPPDISGLTHLLEHSEFFVEFPNGVHIGTGGDAILSVSLG